MMESELSHYEELLLKSWDATLSIDEKKILSKEIQLDSKLRKESEQYLKVRELLKRTQSDSFGPFFAERILNVIKNRADQLEYQIFFFFKKYQVLVLGVFVALLIANLLLSDQLTFKSILNLEKETTEEIFSIDLYKTLNP
jgi:hypothetical protein